MEIEEACFWIYLFALCPSRPTQKNETEEMHCGKTWILLYGKQNKTKEIKFKKKETKKQKQKTKTKKQKEDKTKPSK